MREGWRELEEFYGYVINQQGDILSVFTNRFVGQRFNNTGVMTVSLYQDGRQRVRSVALLVASTWLPEPEREDFTTPIHLDGDRGNCRVENLMWRPRWFAIAFHRERNRNPFPNWRSPIEVVETSEIFTCPRECSMKYGNLETDIYLSIANETFVFPQWFHYKWA